MTDKYVLATDDDFEIITPPEEETNGLMAMSAMSAMSTMSGDEYEVPGDDEFDGTPLLYIGDAKYVEVPHYINGELVTDYSYMFSNTLVEGVRSTNSHVTSFYRMFYYSGATELDLSEFLIPEKVIDSDRMFQVSRTKIGYARTQEDADFFNATTNKPDTLTFVVKPTEPEEPEEPTNPIISTEEVIEEKPKAYETEYIQDRTMMVGEEVVDREGIEGIIQETYEVTTYEDGTVESELILSETIKEPVNEIVRQGTIVSIKEEVIETSIEYETEYIEDDTLMATDEVIEQEGLAGTTRETYEVTTHNDGEVDRVLIDTEITEPVAEIIRVGTKVEQPIKGQSPEERINLSLQRQFRTLNEDSYHYLTDNRNSVDHQLVFKTGFGSSMSWNSQDLTIIIDIFNTGSISRTFDLIESIKEHFTNRIMKVDGEFMVKFPPEHPITKQRIMETPSNEIRHYQLEMEARVTYDAKPRQGFQYTPL